MTSISRLGAIVLLALGAQACGTVGLGIGYLFNDNAKVEPASAKVDVASSPRGAQIFEQRGNNYIARGSTPTSLDVAYTLKGGRSSGMWVGWSVGTALDLGLGYLSYNGLVNTKPGDMKDLPITGLVAAGLALVCDGIVLAATGATPQPKMLTVVARDAGYQQVRQTIRVPSARADDGLFMKLEPTASILSAAQLARAAIPKRNLGRILVLNIKTGSGVPSSLVPQITSLTTSEISTYSKQQVMGMADVNAILASEKVKDALSCNDATCVASIGGSLGTDVVLAGSVGRVGSYLLISYRVIDTKRAVPIGRVSFKASIGKRSVEDTLVSAIPKAVAALVKSISPR